jgi:CheY-like chemotaxis protein
LHVSRIDQIVTVKVIDVGLGIPANMLERIFDMFGQVNKTLDRAQGGLGIGLALVRQLVELHNGTVKAESAGEGQGSIFTIALPIAPEQHEVTTSSQGCVQPPISMPHNVLVVDDNIDAAESLAMYLRMQGHSVRVANSPSVGLEIVNEFKPDVVFLDIGLPEMNGYEVAKRIRAMPSLQGVRLVAVTGWGGEKDKENAKNVGFDLHLTKPVDPAAAQALLERATPSPAVGD